MNKTNNTRTKMDYVVFDSDYDYSYEDYVEYCEMNDMTPDAKDSMGYWDYVNEEHEVDWDCFRENLRFSENNGKCMVTGVLGLWDGRPHIVPEVFDTITEAIDKICNVSFDYNLEVRLKDGYLQVRQGHHDGVNWFEIHLLSAKGCKEVERPCYEDKDFQPKKWWFKNIYGYLY